MHRLKIHHVATLDLPETSALTMRSQPEGRLRLLAVGDEDFAVVSTEIDDHRGTLADTRRDDLRPVLRNTPIDLRSGSGFEGVASDGDGTTVLLQEEQARLLVFAPDLTRLLHTLVLAVPADDPVLNPAWHREPNSRGEGHQLGLGGVGSLKGFVRCQDRVRGDTGRPVARRTELDQAWGVALLGDEDVTALEQQESLAARVRFPMPRRVQHGVVGRYGEHERV